MRRAALLFGAAFMTASNAGSQSPGSFTYKGWAVGISFDSAQKLAARDIRAPLQCQGVISEPMRCSAGPREASGGFVSIELSRSPRKVISVGLMEPIGARASLDSIKRAFTKRWGPPRDLPAEKTIAKRSLVHRPVGIWIADGVMASVSEITMLGQRMVAIDIGGAEHIRNMMIAALKSRGLSDDSIRVILKRMPPIR